MTLKVAVELLVVLPLVLEKFKVWELYAVSRGIGLGGAPLADEVELHENVVVDVELVELDELFVEELETEADEELPDMDELAAMEELVVLTSEVVEDEDDEDGPLPLSARYAAAPPTARTSITTTAITA